MRMSDDPSLRGGTMHVPGRTAPSFTVSMLSTYPPTACGLATFASALSGALTAQGHRVDIVRVADGSMESDASHRVAGHLLPGSPSSVRRAALVLSEADVAIIQHEYGIFGGRDGEEVLDVMRLVTVPVITVLHTVPIDPQPNQRRILEEITRRSAHVVVMTRCSHDRLVGRYDVDPASIVTIPHGAIVADGSSRHRSSPLHPHPEVLSWGLLSPGKGIERVIDAIGTLNENGHRVHYTISGMTHPKVLRAHGEEYRESLVQRVRDRRVSHLVRFDRTYREPQTLADYLSTSSVIVLPYASTDQAVSGVLVDSIAAGRPVIATAFPHAVELLSTGAGILVGHDDHDGLVAALLAVTGDRDLREAMATSARLLADLHSWPAVASAYADLAFHARVEQQLITA
jgi:glycosyltransferase involved in cell wall biosynthesis